MRPRSDLLEPCRPARETIAAAVGGGHRPSTREFGVDGRVRLFDPECKCGCLRSVVWRVDREKGFF